MSLIPIAAAALAVHVLGNWIRALVLGTDTIADRDWVGFSRVGFLWARGHIDEIYSGAALSPQPFVYPPFVTWACTPFALWSSPWPPFLLTVLASLLATAAIVLASARIFAGGQRSLAAAALLLVASAPWLACVMTGQLSVLLCAAAMSSLWAWRAGRPLLAGVLLSLLACKPNLLLPLVALLVVQRSGRVLGGVLPGVAVLVLSSLPLGPRLWADYFGVSQHVLDALLTGSWSPWMHQTLLAFWTWALHSAVGFQYAWLATVALAGVAVVSTWRRTPDGWELPRLYGQALLFVVAVNPYMFPYDGLLLAVPALVWALDREHFRGVAHWRACGALMAAVFVWQHVALLSHYLGCPPLVGPLCLAWLLLDTDELRRQRRARRDASAPSPALGAAPRPRPASSAS